MGSSPDDDVQCMRCVREFSRLFKFWPEAAKIPLDDGEEPGEPEAARKRFTFYAGDGSVLSRTWSPRSSQPRLLKSARR